MITPTVLHEDTFYAFFKPRSDLGVESECWGGHGLETYGEDLEIVRRYDENFLWTIVEGDSVNDQWIVPGFHYVNRVCYVITEVPHNGAEVEFRVERGTRFLTALGLTRQLRKLERLLSMHA